MPTSGSNDIYINNFQLNPQFEYVLDKLISNFDDEYESGELTEPLKLAAQVKYREIISETVSEYTRKGNFVRIFPARNSKLYDKYFGG